MSEEKNMLSLRHYASEMRDHVTVAHWVNQSSDYHHRIVHESFAEMASILGYEIKHIEPAVASLDTEGV
tara:strand:+ start:2787 stop:2993 length:207 start_codon:yes stop_codon:yes gene_type:complete